MSNVHSQHILEANSYEDLLSKPFAGSINALCFPRSLPVGFEEVLQALLNEEDLRLVSPEELMALNLSGEGQGARDFILNDFKRLSEHGASPQLNVIKHYPRDTDFPFFPTDVYSFHVDASPIPTSTFLCTYFGAPSEILPNAQALQKMQIPEIRAQLKKLYKGPEAGFEDFLHEHFFDLHYEPLPGATPLSLGLGHLWRLAVKHPTGLVPPCIHRAPVEGFEEPRLILIC